MPESDLSITSKHQSPVKKTVLRIAFSWLALTSLIAIHQVTGFKQLTPIDEFDPLAFGLPRYIGRYEVLAVRDGSNSPCITPGNKVVWVLQPTNLGNLSVTDATSLFKTVRAVAEFELTESVLKELGIPTPPIVANRSPTGESERAALVQMFREARVTKSCQSFAPLGNL